MAIFAEHVGIIILAWNKIATVNFPFGLFCIASGLQFNPTFARPLRDTGSLCWFTGKALNLIFLKLKDQSSQSRDNRDVTRPRGNYASLSGRTCLNAYVKSGKDTMPFFLWSLYWSQKQIQIIFPVLLLWAAWLCKLSAKPSKWEARYCHLLGGCRPNLVCVMAGTEAGANRNKPCCCNIPEFPRLIRPSHSFITVKQKTSTWRFR